MINYVNLFSINEKHRRKEEEQEHGIFFDDDYNYLQHVKARTNLTLESLPDNITVIEAKKPQVTDHLEVLACLLI